MFGTNAVRAQPPLGRILTDIMGRVPALSAGPLGSGVTPPPRGLFGSPMLNEQRPWDAPGSRGLPSAINPNASPNAAPIVHEAVVPTFYKPDAKHMIAGGNAPAGLNGAGGLGAHLAAALQPPTTTPAGGVAPATDAGPTASWSRNPLADALNLPTNPVPVQTSVDLSGARERHPGFFDKDGGWRNALGILGDAVSGAVGGQPIYAQMQAQRRQEQRQDARQAAEWGRVDANRRQDHQWHVEDRDSAQHAPRYFNSGRDRVLYDPTTDQSRVVYDGPEDYQTYADVQGLEPGDDGYTEAVQDYVLRGNGPTSQRARQGLEAQRLQGRLTLRSTPTYANTHPRPRAAGGTRGGSAGPTTLAGVVAPLIAKVRDGKPLTASEQQAFDMYRAGRGGQGRGGALPTIANPADARSLPPGTKFRTPDGRVMQR